MVLNTESLNYKRTISNKSSDAKTVSKETIEDDGYFDGACIL
jgi:hypothetical protein